MTEAEMAQTRVRFQQFIKLILLAAITYLIAGCSTLANKNETGVVMARRAQVRSSVAVVAADLVEVKRGDVVDILDSTDVPDPNADDKKERWYLVRAHDADNTEGWIEARNIMPQEMLERARKLADEDKETQPQAMGQLRASTNLRLSPDRSNNDNIVMRLESGAPFEIIGWKRVPKPKSSETTESDIAPKAGTVQQNAGKGAKESDEKEPEETNELWYKVRLPPSISPAPAGWIYGKQVELAVPSDIIFYRTGREFVAWHRLDEDTDTDPNAPKDKDAAAKETKPGSWVILEKSSSNEPHKIDEPDFDRIYVLGYDKRTQEHYTAYRSPDLKGHLPLTVSGHGGDKTFTVRVEGDDGQIKDAQYTVYKDDKGLLKVTAPSESRGKRRK